MADLDAIILQQLLDGKGHFISGSKLARDLGISRVGVWNRLEKLRKQGFAFEAVRNRGYRVSAEPEELNGALLRAYLRKAEGSARILYFPEIDSTNSEAERQLTSGRECPFVILSSKQTMGRGRMGRTWHSPEEGNCYMSFVFRPSLHPERMQKFTLWMGLKICDLLNAEFELPVLMKWPNDLVINNRKAGGMLTEARVEADRTRDLIFGLGLNVNSRCSQWEGEFPLRATSLAEAGGRTLPLNRLAANVVTAGLRGYREFRKGHYEKAFQALWKRYDALRGRSVITRCKAVSQAGIAHGIDPSGALLLRLENNREVRLRAGEVSLSP